MRFLIRSLVSIPVITILAGCNQGVGRLEEKAAIEGKASSEATIKAENENLAKKSKAMEEDLSQRHRFYQALKGKYEGSFQTKIGQINFRITFTPSLPPHKTNRVRQLDEISSNLNNLYLNAQVIQWIPTNEESAVGCRISQVRPDIMNGEITLASESCSNLYRLKISENGVLPEEFKAHAVRLADWIADGKIERVEMIVGEIQPSTSAAIYSITAIRKE